MKIKSFTITMAILLVVSLGVNLSGDDQPSAEKTNWSEFISTKTIEDEVARIHLQLEQDTSSPPKFLRGGYRSARRQFSELAMLFAIVEQSDTPINWSKAAPQLRFQFSRTASNCKVGTQQVLNEVNKAKAQLQMLLAGDDLPANVQPGPPVWPEVVDIPPLMQQMEQWHSHLNESLANQKSFAANRDQLKRNAELIAAVATVIRQPLMEYEDDAEFAGHARSLSRHAGALGRVVDRGDYNAARVAQRMLIKNCNNCHEAYR